MKIGYVGLGAMGSALADWLLADHSLLVWDLNPATLERFVARGGTAATSLAQLARDSDIIMLCLPRSADVEKAVFGDDGLAAGLSAGKLVIDQTSGVPKDTAGFARRLEAMGVTMLDAPVAGGVPAATAGKITIMVSGPREAQAVAMPVFRAMTSKVYPAGNRVGDGQTVKTLNNMLNMIQRVSTLELAALGVKIGVPLETLTRTIEGGIGANFTARSVLPAILEGRSSGSFALTLMLKDNNLAISIGMEEGVPMPLSCLARGILQQNINIVGPEAGLDDVITFMARATGADFMGPTEAGMEASQIADRATLIADALAACNRMAVYEIFSLADQLNLDLREFGNILNDASAWSRECETVLAEIAGEEPTQVRRLGDTVATLREVERLAVREGVSILMAGAVRAIHEAALDRLGSETALDRLAPFSHREAGLTA